jgi:hypothetical protein
LQRRKTPAYDAAKGRNVPVADDALPNKPLFSLSMQQLDSIPEYIDVTQPQVFQSERCARSSIHDGSSMVW